MANKEILRIFLRSMLIAKYILQLLNHCIHFFFCIVFTERKTNSYLVRIMINGC